MKRKLSIAICLVMLVGTLFSSMTNSYAATSVKSTAKPIIIKTTLQDADLGADNIVSFEKANPNIKIQEINADDSKVMAMIASGNSPDIFRANGIVDVPAYVSKNLALPLDKYLAKSKVFPPKDLLPVQNLYRWDGKKTGAGPVYGFVRDWSMDTQLWINKKVFADAGVPLPPTNRPMTYAELFNTSKALTKIDANGNVVRWGFGTWVETYFQVMVMLAQQNKSLWSDNFNKTTFTSPDTMKALQYWVDFAKAGACGSPLHQLSDGYGGNLFMQDQLGITMEGYWFSASIRSNDKLKNRLNDFMLLPSPVMDSSKKASYCLGGTGCIVYKGTKNPDACWKLIEYIFGNGPITNARVKTGWGLPIFNSKMNLLPSSTIFDQQVLSSVKTDVKNEKTNISINPYVSRAAVNGIFDKYFTPVLFDKMKLSDAAKQMDKELVSLIQDGKEIAGVN